jgi:hypothetical protein
MHAMITYLLHRVTAIDVCRYDLDSWSRFFAFRPLGGVYPEPGRRRPVQGQTPDDVAAAMRRAYPEARLELPPETEVTR